MRALRRRPAPEQHIHANAEVDQRDQAQAGVERPVRRYQNQRSFQRHALAEQGIGGFRPDTGSVESALQTADVRDLVILDGGYDIAGLDASLFAGTVRVDALGTKMLPIFYPPDPVVWGRIFTVFLEVDACENDGRNAEQRQENREEARLEVSIHQSHRLVLWTH